MFKHNYSIEELNQPGIYILFNKLNNKAYIGSTIRFSRRVKDHYQSLIKGIHHSKYLQNAWNKYGEELFEFKVLEIVPKEEWTDNKYLTDVEQTWLDAYQPEYNMSPTAGSTLGYKHSDESKLKIGAKSVGRYFSEECRDNMSAMRKGKPLKPHSEETKNQLRNINKGKTLSEETKLKIGDSQKGKKISAESIAKQVEKISLLWIIYPPIGKSFVIKNLTKFALENNLKASNLSRVASGLQKHHKGYKVQKYIEDLQVLPTPQLLESVLGKAPEQMQTDTPFTVEFGLATPTPSTEKEDG